MQPEIVATGSGRYVRALADRANVLREYLLCQGIPCGPLRPDEEFFQSFRLGETANLGLVQALLDRWGAPDPPERT